ncbi:unnamed protein product [Mycena citricolor]|uniref:Cation/H+ exchanger transmembrane domain-containing protein n=1 Tax=Mycena citricolor TaxID=2018698 RepID=A0AAD2HWH1_9AGAR|nr:unnamed protein product [Mycena citricolor]
MWCLLALRSQWSFVSLVSLLPAPPGFPAASLVLSLMPEFSSTIISLFHSRAAAPEQGGLLSGKNPTAYNTADPLRLWIIQVGIIVATASLLSLVLRKIRQPKVIAEVLGGIILGPTAFGAIPHFTDRIFPPQSIPYLSLVANIGLVLFLFLVGLEIDGSIIKRNARLSASVAAAGMILPFGLGAALSVPLYHEFILPVAPNVRFTYFMLFSGVAFSITAFPVLCRILTELKLLDTTVGIVVLSAGVGNDIVGWVLLALSVALVNAGSGLTALWILLACVGWTLFLLFPVRIALRWLAYKTGSVENGPTMLFMTVTILLVFGSAFFTDVIGVHAIFGAFVMGLTVPREGGLTIALTEKLEDMVSIIFLPTYFTISGLSTNLRLLDTGITWGYTITICVLAFVGKFGGCTLSARYLAGFNLREASAVGSLMSCKGLVELIVLNVGLSAGILTPRVFSMFVLEALTLTFMTTPLVTVLYPPALRVRASGSGANFDNVSGADEAGHRQRVLRDGARTRFTFVLDKIEHLPGLMSIAQLIQPSGITQTSSSGSSTPENRRTSKSSASSESSELLSISALRLLELSDRVSAVMRSSASESLLHSDPVLSIFRMFGELHDLRIDTALSIVPFDNMAPSVTEHAQSTEADMIVLPWLPFATHADGVPTLEPHETAPVTPRQSQNPFDALFRATGGGDRSASALHAQFVRGVFSDAPVDVALCVNQERSAVGHAVGSKQHLMLVFFGGPDDRMALEFVVQLCAGSTHVTATVLRMFKREMDTHMTPIRSAHFGPEKNEETNALTVASAMTGFPDTVYGHVSDETRMQSQTADSVAWEKYATDETISRIDFREITTPIPLHAAIHESRMYHESHPSSRLLIVLGRSRRLAVENHAGELKELTDEYGAVGSEVRKTMGDVATAFVAAGTGSGLLVMQAAKQ